MAVNMVLRALMTTTGNLARSRLMRGSKSRPFSSGITTSVITKSPIPSLIQFHKVAALPVQRTS